MSKVWGRRASLLAGNPFPRGVRLSVLSPVVDTHRACRNEAEIDQSGREWQKGRGVAPARLG